LVNDESCRLRPRVVFGTALKLDPHESIEPLRFQHSAGFDAMYTGGFYEVYSLKE
jgi:hypothetical protein